MAGLRVVLTVLAVYRLTRLVTRDQFPPLLKFRVWVEVRRGQEDWLTYLTQCSFCASVWLGAFVVFATDYFVEGGLPVPVLVWATASALSGLIASMEPNT